MHRLLFLFFCITFSSCSISKKQEAFHKKVSYFQHCHNDSIKYSAIDSTEIREIFFSYSELQRVHDKRLELFKKENINTPLNDGYIYILDQMYCCYSGNTHHGNIWSKEFNIYYYGSSISDFKLNKDPKMGNDWFLFKRAIEEWDLSQIDRYYDYWDPIEGGVMIATKIKIKNNTIIDIQTYQWHNPRG